MTAAATELWCRDLVSCLQATLAAVVADAGHDPVEVLGAHWEFRFRPGDVRPEEFYYPCRVPGDLAASLAPHHPLRSAWHRPTGADPLAELAAAVAAGPVIAAVDNFHLPFRPAYGDVHAAHLVLVLAVDGDGVTVHDAMPPAYRGPVDAADFLRAWSSANPADGQDAFFSAAAIGRRYLTVHIGPPADLDARAVLAANLAGFAAGAAGGDWTGTAGLARWLDQLVGGGRQVLADAYPFGWGMQAQASLHAEWLRHLGVRRDVPELREAARRVEAVAHAWTPVRMTAAHGLADPAGCAGDLARHAAGLRQAHEIALAALADAVPAIPAVPGAPVVPAGPGAPGAPAMPAMPEAPAGPARPGRRGARAVAEW